MAGANIWAWLAVVLAAIGCAIATPYIYRFRRSPVVADEAPAKPLDGWLAVLALRVCSTPLAIAYGLYKARAGFSRAGWVRLVDPTLASYRPAAAATLLGELVIQVVFAFYSAILIAALFQRRSAFRFHFIVFSIAIVVYAIVDTALCRFLLDSSQSLSSLENRVAGQIVVAALFVRYVHLSPRVKLTFTRT